MQIICWWDCYVTIWWQNMSIKFSHAIFAFFALCFSVRRMTKYFRRILRRNSTWLPRKLPRKFFGPLVASHLVCIVLMLMFCCQTRQTTKVRSTTTMISAVTTIQTRGNWTPTYVVLSSHRASLFLHCPIIIGRRLTVENVRPLCDVDSWFFWILCRIWTEIDGVRSPGSYHASITTAKLSTGITFKIVTLMPAVPDGSDIILTRTLLMMLTEVIISKSGSRERQRHITHIAPQAAYFSCSGAFCVTDRTGLQPICRGLGLRPQTSTYDQAAICSPVLLCNRRKPELAWLADTCGHFTHEVVT